MPLSWPELNNVHPFAPLNQIGGYNEMIKDLNKILCAITKFDSFSLQPNSGAQGEYAGLLTIKGYLNSINQSHRNIVVIPISAHGTNPASAAMAGFKVVIVKSDPEGNLDLEDLKVKVEKHKDNLACIMITYPSTHGILENTIRPTIDLIHKNGGQVNFILKRFFNFFS